MRIGIDLDGVTADIMSPFLKYYNEKYSTNFLYNSLIVHDFWEVIGITKEEAIVVLHNFYEEVDFDEIKPIESAIESIKLLGEKNELIAITARPLSYQTKTLLWLDKYLPGVFNEVVFTNQFSKQNGDSKTTKGAICKEKRIDVMIEDFEKYALDCAQCCKNVLLFDQPWNRHYREQGNIIRVNNWEEVLREVDGF